MPDRAGVRAAAAGGALRSSAGAEPAPHHRLPVPPGRAAGGQRRAHRHCVQGGQRVRRRSGAGADQTRQPRRLLELAALTPATASRRLRRARIPAGASRTERWQFVTAVSRTERQSRLCIPGAD